MKFTVSSILLVVFAVFSAIMGVSTMAVSLDKKAALTVFDPPITFPTPGSTFTRGQTITVTWNTSSIPPGTLNEGLIVLARPIDGNENPLETLVTGFLLTSGSVQITWPTDVPAGNNYGLVLFGDSGNLFAPYTLN
ncbi:hypothetical protein M422DRAFT_49118 [Sphaerobolus stellatus SS14]|uniref:Yeast cell wall synthesis Kre9/Knh1-like N-terminal domain-containing protein n=1 Tax=Sphaerobolus stellatus (strain SS14) TaxID=990650 RepID=A0A0C9UL30_SPHS4|nr:hypothetical protein M422DRAFT_51462 [Sphaerobolus stellatus SS14]KIJ40596.1 hypothetical protein M422DRAFT_49118 [Sphaerobolus stellatus SS14]